MNETYEDSDTHRTSKFDDNGDLIEFNDNGIVYYYEYKYKYDNYNWIEKITFIGEAKIPSIITERIIGYYE